MKEFIINNLEEIDDIASEFVSELKNTYSKYTCIAFYGSMGAGKTTFIKAVCKAMNVQSNVTSPTFAIINEYLTNDKEYIYHFDLYRISKLSEAYDIGIDDYLYSGNYCLIEWPELIETILPANSLNVSITEIENSKRKVIINK